jgi:hypothetical protein
MAKAGLMMTTLFGAAEIARPEDVIPHLAKGTGDWKKGYSAYELAHSWVAADGVPQSVRIVLDGDPTFHGAQPIEGFFERKVDLGTPGRPSQTDLLLLVKLRSGYGVIAIEGKVDESFGPVIGEWNDGSHGRVRRLARLCETLELAPDDVSHLRYQLLHGTASAVYEARRYHCRQAVMLVHSFSPRGASFDDFAAFAAAMHLPPVRPDQMSRAKLCAGVHLRLAWVADRPS